MLKKTFIHVQGIGRKTEARLWRAGIISWESFLEASAQVLSPGRDAHVRKELELSLARLDDISFFTHRLPSGDLWRLYHAFRNRVVYLDIETGGGYQGTDDITLVGLYDGKEVKTFISGKNLENLEEALENYKMVVTFNGARFDIPYLKRRFPGIRIPPAHVDLYPLMKTLGLRGGLKSIERQRGITREHDIEGLDGYDAVKLWAAYQWGDEMALERLVRYNRADIVNLEPLMEWAYKEMMERVFNPIHSSSRPKGG